MTLDDYDVLVSVYQNKCSTLMGEVDNGGGYASVGGNLYTLLSI